MEQVLYRKYRPRSFGEVVGQDHITNTLINALKSKKIAHAYLFTGPRGVGKTSVARILAYAANGLDYEDDRLHLDIIEIDAASNRRIDEIRDLREKINLVPTSAKYKVYIIDEVHMLTKEAFNALLKTLEEPPEHAIFILATTESYKLPETIVSRTQRFTFKPVEPSVMEKHLKEISKKEKIKIDDEALSLIAEHGEGSFRDSISLLDQLRHQDDQITLENVQNMLGIASEEAISKIIKSIDSKEPSNLIKLLNSMYEQGYQGSTIAKQLSRSLKLSLINNQSTLSNHEITELLGKLIEIPASVNPESMLEVILLDSIFSSPSVLSKPSVAAAIDETTTITETKTRETPVKTKDEAAAPKQSKKIELGEPAWRDLIAAVKESNNALYSVLRIAQPKFYSNKLELHFPFKFHLQRINEAKNHRLISDMLFEITGSTVKIETVLSENDYIPKSDQEKKSKKEVDPDHLETINSIFGDSEMLES